MQVADVRRERELMERRKREPQLEQAQDHLVRKIFSRFRRERSVAAAPPPAPARAAPTALAAPTDPEKGDSSGNILIDKMFVGNCVLYCCV